MKDTSELKRELRKTKKALADLSGTVGEFLRLLDETMLGPSAVARGKQIAKLSNALDMTNDSVRYNLLGVDFRRDKKPTLRSGCRTYYWLKLKERR
jgi:hypothetical protein